jgi:uncharacterized protein (DUF1697 family)
MAADRFVAFLRGINVGGHHRLPMTDLRVALEAAGLLDVRTYIQSGNVVFDRPGERGVADDADIELAIADEIASAVEDACGWSVPVVVRRFDDIERVAGAHPDANGEVPPKWLHVFLLDRAPGASRAAPDRARYAPDRWVVDGREIYATYPVGSGRSKLTIEVFERAFGVTATARNLSTLAKIVELGRR